MGQYHYLINHSKKQYIHPHKIGNGLKLREQVGWEYSTSTALFMLLAASNGRGGGDFQGDSPLIGSWAGDRVSVLGDYAEKDDLKRSRELISKQTDAKHLMDNDYIEKHYRDISADVRKMMEVSFNVEYSGNGWMEVKEKGAEVPHNASPDLILK